MNFEEKIIANLLYSLDYARKVIPFLKTDYFSQEFKVIIESITKFYEKYSDIPTKDILLIEIERKNGINEKTLAMLKEKIQSLQKDDSNFDWLIQSTEKFCRDRAMYNAILKGAQLLNEKSDNLENIQKQVTDALSITFDNSIGHDYFEDYEERYAEYQQQEDKISWGIKSLDDITEGGISKKNLVCVLAGTGVGKSLFMCSIAANAVRNGNNVVYISLEMSERRIAERIDANFMREPIREIKNKTLEEYRKKCSVMNEKAHGKLIIKEFPTSTANVNHFKAFLNDLKLKKEFTPDLVVVDYINICASSRVKPGQNSYGYIKAISEELRGLAVEEKIAILTATQLNRNGVSSSSVEITDVAESFGLTHVMDFMFALTVTPALEDSNQVEFKQLKNRYDSIRKCETMTLGMNRELMRVYDLNSNEDGNDPKLYSSTYIKPVEKTFEDDTGITRTIKSEPSSDFSSFVF